MSERYQLSKCNEYVSLSRTHIQTDTRETEMRTGGSMPAFGGMEIILVYKTIFDIFLVNFEC